MALLRPVTPNCHPEHGYGPCVGYEAPGPGARDKLPVKTDGGNRGEQRENSDRSQQWAVFRGKLCFILRKEQDHHPGEQQPDRQRDRGARDTGE